MSGADIFTTIAHNASEIRAVTRNYTYSLKRPSKGWGLSESDAWDVFGKKKFAMETNPSAKTDRVSFKERNTKSNNEKVLALNRKRSSFTKEEKSLVQVRCLVIIVKQKKYRNVSRKANDRGNVGTQYQVMKEYAKKYGWILTRKRTS